MNDKNKKKRILWIFAHTTLRNFEIPILEKLGYEIYCPKKYTVEAGDLSVSITYKYDNGLSIPREDIEKLNSVDFYSELSCETISLINKYFGIAFVMICKESLRSLILGFNGAIVLHVFGLCGDVSYGNVLFDLLGQQLYLKIRDIGNRFWFSYTYENLIEIEPDILKNRGIFMPIGIKETINKQWKGGDGRLLFVSPKINSNKYYYGVYKDFKENFGEFPHVLGGGQIIKVTNDDNVTGFLSREEYDYNMTSLCGMFYHSQNPRHIHYHPIEAMRNGMPVLFMAGGMLDYLDGDKLPGRCKDIKDAKNKIKKLIKGDKLFIRKVVKKQSKILKYFTTDYCFPYWKNAMRRIEESIDNPIKMKKRIAVILPDKYTGGVLDYSLRFALSLKKYSEIEEDNLEIIYAYIDCDEYDIGTFADLVKNGIILRNFWSEKRDSEWINKTYEFLGINPTKIKLSSENNVTVFCDGMKNFGDCDYCFIMSDSFNAPLFMLSPYSIVVHDYIQRYIPHMMSKEVKYAKIKTQTNADYVLTTSKPTYEDAINYAGINPQKVMLTPPLFSIIKKYEPFKEEEEKYFLWSTNCSKHKNHLLVLETLQEYYAKGGHYKCLITGTNTEAFMKEEIPENYSVDIGYVNSVKCRIAKINNKKKKIIIRGRMNKEAY